MQGLDTYLEANFHGPNFVQPPPDLINGEEEYKVEEILDSGRHGRGHKVWKCDLKGALDHRGYKGTAEEDIRLYYDGYYFTTHLQRRI